MSEIGLCLVFVFGMLSPILAYATVGSCRSQFADPTSTEATLAATKIGGRWIVLHGLACFAIYYWQENHRLQVGSVAEAMTSTFLIGVLSVSMIITFLAATSAGHRRRPEREPFQPLQ